MYKHIKNANTVWWIPYISPDDQGCKKISNYRIAIFSLVILYLLCNISFFLGHSVLITSWARNIVFYLTLCSLLHIPSVLLLPHDYLFVSMGYLMTPSLFYVFLSYLKHYSKLFVPDYIILCTSLKLQNTIELNSASCHLLIWTCWFQKSNSQGQMLLVGQQPST